MTTDKLDPEMTARMQVVLLECKSICERMDALTNDLAMMGLFDLNNHVRFSINQIKDKLPFGLLKSE